jgi:hypothetical protein
LRGLGQGNVKITIDSSFLNATEELKAVEPIADMGGAEALRILTELAKGRRR